MSTKKRPPASSAAPAEAVIRSSADLGSYVRSVRINQDMRQLAIAGIANTGNRFIVDLENGKPTVQLQKVLDVLEILGIELLARKKGAPRP